MSDFAPVDQVAAILGVGAHGSCAGSAVEALANLFGSEGDATLCEQGR